MTSERQPPPELGGIHHVTAVTADASGNYRFYTDVLGMRLVKRTVNQDDVSAYHLFYADGEGSAGSDLTFSIGRSAVSAVARTASFERRCGSRVEPASLGGSSA